jgi:tryptophan halogenase
MEYRSVDNLVVVGGGTAGWLTALSAKKKFPNSNVTLIESEEIGILGAGEGSTPNLMGILEDLGISLDMVISETQSTLKNGIRFVNWKNDGEYFYHNFALNYDYANNLDNNNAVYNDSGKKHNYYYLIKTFENTPSKELTTICLLNEQNKSPFILIKKEQSTSILAPISTFSIHFDATQLAKLLKKVALERGVKRIEGKVVSIINDKDNDIKQLELENGLNIDVDFVFDCSGFFRLIIGKHYNGTWKSHSNKLPVKAALPFFLPKESFYKIPPYTDAIAMKYGWIWKIPLQNRFGCGYVYDSDLITEEDARKEIEEYLGFEPEYPRKDKGGFKFNAGYFETPWINNCVSLGLASGFIEPLEATSIGVTVYGLGEIFSSVLNLKIKDNTISTRYNKYMSTLNEEISDFLYLHYMSGRTDTEFWKKFTFENAPKKIQSMLTEWSVCFPKDTPNLYCNILFESENWMAVGLGLGLISKEVVTNFVLENNLTTLKDSYTNMSSLQKERVSNTLSHGDILNLFLKK